MIFRIFFVLLFSVFCLVSELLAETPSLVARNSVRLCTQNLFRVDASKKEAQEIARVRRLASRVSKADCDVLAAQEIAGDSKTAATRSANLFRDFLNEATHKNWIAIVGGSRDKHIRNGFFVNTDIASVVSVESLERIVLPSLQPHGPLTHFSRGPLRIELAIHRLEQPVFLYSMHLKSKANGWRDVSKLQFESWRIEMAEALRRDASLSKGIVAIMGDRNTRHDAASAKVLSGVLRIDDFLNGNCRVKPEPDLRAQCIDMKKRRAKFVPIIQRSFAKQIKKKDVGSYKYKGKWELIDEILVSEGGRKHFSERGLLFGQGDGASDHLLLAVDLMLP